MPSAPDRYTVDLSAYPDLVVIYLGMRVEAPHGLETLQTLGPQIRAAVEEEPRHLRMPAVDAEEDRCDVFRRRSEKSRILPQERGDGGGVGAFLGNFNRRLGLLGLVS